MYLSLFNIKSLSSGNRGLYFLEDMSNGIYHLPVKSPIVEYNAPKMVVDSRRC